MREELDDALVADFPNLFVDRHASMQETCMCWGFDVGDGWEPLIRRLSARLEELILALPESERSAYRAVQVKEKFGGLRFYMTCQTDEMTAAIRKAEAEAMKTCETCGSEGTVRDGSWIVVRCDGCADK